MLRARVCASFVLLLIHRFLQGDAATIPAGDGSLIDTPAPLVNLSLPAVAPPATPSLNDIQIQCQGPLHGTDLNYDSCLDTFGTFEHGRDPTPILIGRRYAGPYVRYLPWRWVGRDGRCIFDIVIKGSASVETASGQEIARAAWKLLNECVLDKEGQGGVVSGIGRAGKLGIILRSNNPSNIYCGPADQRYTEGDNCRALMIRVPADVSPLITWGVGGQLPLPYGWELNGLDCRLSLSGMNGRRDVTDTVASYDIWKAGVMMVGMCARFGKAGKVENLGVYCCFSAAEP
ncbi:MAG: hypothetical protein Q9207_006527 [Kuettlingeria erythrocarpa]